jgi:hypothetical protein
MSKWLKGVEPRDYMHQQLEIGLRQLHLAIVERRKFPVPLSIAQHERKDYILRVRQDDNRTTRVSKPRTAK